MAQLVDRIWNAIGGIANTWVLIALIAIVLIFWFAFFERYKKIYAADKRDDKPAPRTFDGRIGGFTPSQAAADLDLFSPESLKVYKFQASVVDMIFPIVYALAFAVWIRLAAPNVDPSLRWLILLPFLTALFDWLENLCVTMLIGRYQAGARTFGALPTVLLVFQRLKWLGFGAILVVMVIVTIGWIRRAM